MTSTRDRLRVLVSAETFLPTMNGVTNSVVRLVRHLDAQGHAVRVVAPGPGPSTVRLPTGNTLDVERITSVRVPRYDSLKVAMTTASRISRVVDEYRPDVVHLAAPVMLGKSMGEASWQRRVPTVALFQTDLAGFAANYGLSRAASPIWSWLRRIHNRADRTLAPTETIATDLRNRGFERVGVWGRGVDHEQFAPSRRSEQFRQSCGVAPGQVLVGYVGRLAAEKGIDMLAALDGDPRIRLVVVGEGPDGDSLRKALPRAHFTGFLQGEALGEAMASLDIFVHTGRHETFCQTVQEAMAACVPVVAPAAGGPLDLVKPDVTGRLYRPGDRADLRSQLEPLIEDVQLRARLARAGAASVSDRTWSALGDELLGEYEAAISAMDGMRRRELAGAR